ncbi:MAG: hypothetical protein GTO14_06920 [Anaerolineales bacterium]|nr:hypothetical protein [Anaerolineales bacterium]
MAKSGKILRGEVAVAGEKCGYSFYAIDARTEDQRLRNTQTGTLDGDLIVFIPGHGQRSAAARRLQSTLIEASASKVLWSIDVDPPRGGDPVKTQAVIEIVRQKVSEELNIRDMEGMGQQPTFKTVLIGWSHGGAIVLRAAEKAPDLFPKVAALCPAGLEQRGLPELLGSFVVEILLIAFDAIRKGPRSMAIALRMGGDMLIGLTMDFVRSKSLRRLIDDIRWGATKVVGSEYMYPGRVVVLFAEADKVIRWRGAVPECRQAEELNQHLVGYERRSFPHVQSFNLRILKGNHLAPELFAPLYVQNIFETLNLSSDA